MQEYSGRICQPPEGFITIVVARFNKTITQRLLDGALARLRQHNVSEQDIHVVWVPGAFEIPIVANYYARDLKCLAVICLGAIIKGDTSHDLHIGRAVSMTIAEIAAKQEKPIVFGVLTCDNIEQAQARSGIIESAKDKIINPAPGNKGAEAADTALEMIDLLTELPEQRDTVASAIPAMLSKILGVQIHEFNPGNPQLHNLFSNLYQDEDDDDDDDDFLDDDDDDDDDDGIDIDAILARLPRLPKPPKKKTKKVTKKKKK
ncbi:MAG: 6,7-dimethyl-8-ribityllumazine synthase [Planctomycetaceae bacterium]|jgi:6,7-dimethyl-8-ribityllumazine synthase|nr:6,7-dimethyl-8-ribityllumazine synthase [Planctomycetaceae bacterium]